ncbi:MAG TPA: PatB family C-S lyase [Phycisphaerae bacterium]|nr:PatB family C-S lyase [Phycisphaerae bacterium]
MLKRSDLELDIATLRHADSFKWTRYPPDVLPLWVADMDFAIAPSIRAALRNRFEHPIGYNQVEGDPVLMQLLREKLERGGWENLPARGWVRFLPGVVPAIAATVLGLTKPGEGVVTMTPIYPPFLGSITDHGRELREAPLAQGADRWEIDWDTMEAAATGGQAPAKLLLFCHPHNPTGRMWTVEELAKVGEFAERHNLWLVSDELHADLSLDGPHVPLVTVLTEAQRKRTITLTGPCKTYNTAGLGIGAMVGHDAVLVSRVMKANMWIVGHPSALSVAMWKAAMQDNGEWLAAVLDYLRDNRDFLETFVRERLPGVRLKHVQATYLAWLDYRSHPQAATIGKYLLDHAKVALNEGAMFGKGYEGFVRLNFATSRAILSEALDRMARVH